MTTLICKENNDMKNNVIDIIIEFIKAIKNNKWVEYIDENERKFSIDNPKYILGQILRHYYLPWSHYYVSQKAKDLWESITTQNWRNCWYKNLVKCDKANDKQIVKYKGASNEPYFTGPIKVGERFCYRDVFHDEHMVTISDIIKDLLKLDYDKIDVRNVTNILDKMYVCRMLKSEDRLLWPKRHRSINVEEVIEGPYKKAEIIIIKDYFTQLEQLKNKK